MDINASKIRVGTHSTPVSSRARFFFLFMVRIAEGGSRGRARGSSSKLTPVRSLFCSLWDGDEWVPNPKLPAPSAVETTSAYEDELEAEYQAYHADEAAREDMYEAAAFRFFMSNCGGGTFDDEVAFDDEGDD